MYEKYFDTKDPQVERIAELGEQDPKYMRMIYHITNRTPAKQMEEDCELRAMEGILKDLSIHITASGKQIILKNAVEIMIPEAERKNKKNFSTKLT